MARHHGTAPEARYCREMVPEPPEPEVALNILRNIVRGFSYPADRQLEVVERHTAPGGEPGNPVSHVPLLQQIWRKDRDAIRARFSLSGDVVGTIDRLVETVTRMEEAWRAGAAMDDFDGPEWSRLRALAQAILLRTPNTRDARLRDRDVLATIPPTEDGLRRLLDALEGSVRLEIEPGTDMRDHYTDLSEAIAALGTAFPTTFVEEVRRRDLYDDRTLTWGIHLMGELPSPIAPLLLVGYLESSARNRSGWLELLMDYPQHAARDDLIRALIDPSDSIRVQAAVALRRIGDPSVADALEGAIADRPPTDQRLLHTMELALAALRRR
jgi:hypothetical protein